MIVNLFFTLFIFQSDEVNRRLVFDSNVFSKYKFLSGEKNLDRKKKCARMERHTRYGVLTGGYVYTKSQ